MGNTTKSFSNRAVIEQGDPVGDSRAFRRCLGSYPTGVAVITTLAGENRVGMAVNSFAAVSLYPPLILWSVRKESKSLSAFTNAPYFAVNILASDQAETSRQFGSADPNRFSHSQWQRGIGGIPLLEGAIGHLECRTAAVHDGGDHQILVGHVERYARYEGEPLVFSQGQYSVSQPLPQAASSNPVDKVAPKEVLGQQTSFLRLLSQAQQRMSTLFDDHRRELGLTPASTRVLSCMGDMSFDLGALERSTFLSREALEDTFSDLTSAGFAIRLPAGEMQLTELGKSKRSAIADRSAKFTETQLAGISSDDIAAAERVLQALHRR